MDKKIYHGSSHAVISPGFGEGSAYRDFGLGFYCSEYPLHAAEWAVQRDRNGIVSAYSIRMDGLRIINLCSPQYTALHWLWMLFNYREFDTSLPLVHQAREYISRYFAVDHQGCDCIIGWRADNSCFMLAQEFLSGHISYQDLTAALSAGSANRQFVLKSNRAFDRISFAGCEPAVCSRLYPGAASRELRAIRSMQKSAGRAGLYVGKMIEEEVKPYDTRLQ